MEPMMAKVLKPFKYPDYILERIVSDPVKCEKCHIQPAVTKTKLGEDLCSQCE